MNPLGDVFGIFQQRGLVEKVKKEQGLGAFLVAGFVLLVVFGAIYGFAMGISVDKSTAIKDAIKMSLVYLLAFGISFPAFLMTSRLVGFKESVAQLACLFMSLFLISATVLAIAAPIVFFYGLMIRNPQQLYFIHIILIDVAVLLGISVMGTALYYSVDIEKSRLALPVGMGVLFVVLAALVLALFFQPFFYSSKTFCVGWDRLVVMFKTAGKT